MNKQTLRLARVTIKSWQKLEIKPENPLEPGFLWTKKFIFNKTKLRILAARGQTSWPFTCEAKEVNSQDYLLELQLADSNCIASSVIIMFRQLDNDILSIFYILSGCFRFPNHWSFFFVFSQVQVVLFIVCFLDRTRAILILLHFTGDISTKAGSPIISCSLYIHLLLVMFSDNQLAENSHSMEQCLVGSPTLRTGPKVGEILVSTQRWV